MNCETCAMRRLMVHKYTHRDTCRHIDVYIYTHIETYIHIRTYGGTPPPAGGRTLVNFAILDVPDDAKQTEDIYDDRLSNEIIQPNVFEKLSNLTADVLVLFNMIIYQYFFILVIAQLPRKRMKSFGWKY